MYILCFRESRSHCVDLETAYKQGCQKLDDRTTEFADTYIIFFVSERVVHTV